MQLHYEPNSPFVRKVMATAIECGLVARIDLVAIATEPTKPNSELARVNPLVKLPTFITDDGMVLYDSSVICEHLDSLHDGAKLFPRAGSGRFLALRQQSLGDGMLDAAILARYEMRRPKEFQWPDWIEAQLGKVRGAIAALDSEAAEGTLSGEITIGHLAIACALEFIDRRFESWDWRRRSHALARWCEVISNRPSMTATAPKGRTATAES